MSLKGFVKGSATFLVLLAVSLTVGGGGAKTLSLNPKTLAVALQGLSETR